jgi:hypothetical protein
MLQVAKEKKSLMDKIQRRASFHDTSFKIILGKDSLISSSVGGRRALSFEGNENDKKMLLFRDSNKSVSLPPINMNNEQLPSIPSGLSESQRNNRQTITFAQLNRNLQINKGIKIGVTKEMSSTGFGDVNKTPVPPDNFTTRHVYQPLAGALAERIVTSPTGRRSREKKLINLSEYKNGMVFDAFDHGHDQYFE